MIELFHVHKQYDGSDEVALRDANLAVDKGEFCFLTGASGAGKSTLLKLLFCAEFASAGQVMVQGKNVARLAKGDIPQLRRRIGVVFQDFKLLPDYTVLENVGVALEVQGMAAKKAHDKCTDLLKKVGLAHKSHQRADQLSGGEQQRVAIARALVTDPLLLLADEPTGNLDPDRSKDIMELLISANARGTTVLVATHDMSLVETYKKRRIHLENGTVTMGERPFGA